MSTAYLQATTQYLAGSGVIIGATSIVLTSFTDIYQNAITSMTPFGTTGYITLEPDSSNEEAAIFTSVTVNANGTVTLGGVSTILAQTPYTATSGLVRAHSGGTKLVVTDNVKFWSTFGNKNNDEALVGRWTTPVAPSANNDLVNKLYADNLAIAGAPNASLTVKGIVQSATQAQADAKTATGSTGAVLTVTPDVLRSSLLSDYVASDTGSANAYAIAPAPVFIAYTAGQRFVFKAANANTTASTINVNGLGVKTIKKNGTLDLGTNDIVVGQIVELIYDGTNMQMLSPVGAVTPTGTVSPYAGISAPSGYLLCDGTAVSRTTYASLLGVISPSQTFTVTIASPAVFSATAHGLQIGDKIRLTTTGALPTGLATGTDYFVITAGFTANAFEVSTTRGGSVVNTSGTQSGVHTLRFSNYGVGDGSTTFNVPDLRGLTLYGQKTTDTNFDNLNSPTVYPGEKTHVLTIAELAAHTHTITANTTGGGTTGIGSAGQLATPAVLGSTDSVGSGTAHNNMPPYAVMNYIIKT